MDRKGQLLEVLRLASESHCSACDCELVAVVDELKIPLVTEDRKILRKFPSVAVPLPDFIE